MRKPSLIRRSLVLAAPLLALMLSLRISAQATAPRSALAAGSVEGAARPVSQVIVVVGWVALWAPAQTVAFDILPHHFARKRYDELAEVEHFAWQGLPEPTAERRSIIPRGDEDHKPPASLGDGRVSLA